MIVYLIIMILCLILSALFSGSEIVYTKVNPKKLERDAEAGIKKSAKALKVYNNFDKTLSTVLIGNNLVNIALTSVGAVLALYLSTRSLNEETWELIMTASITVGLLIFGEIFPKSIFQNYSYTLSKALYPFIRFFEIVFYPFVFIFTKVANFFAKLFFKDDLEGEIDSTDELINMTDDLEEKGLIDEDDAELIKQAIDLNDKDAQDIMVPRVDIVAYDIEDGIEEMIKNDEFFENSRVPLYREDIDHIVAIIDTTKVLKYQLCGVEIDFNECLYEPLFVHKTMPIANVLKELKATHKHLAIVLDEWGGTLGIVSIEDILEELFGEIWDETDEVEIELQKIDDSHYLIDGDMNLDDFFEFIDFDDEEYEANYTTVGGWCTEILDRFPQVGDEFDFENIHVEILKIDNVRVEQVKVTFIEKEEE